MPFGARTWSDRVSEVIEACNNAEANGYAHSLRSLD
jgi:hypothetical protein